ncbi:MAG TPA: hypothetical protein VGQ85_08070 [Candidatus Limnocylindrales bacterium]|nr:hypothetical protein [Candidatus Limnocylindrales bacterium]
MSDERTPDPQSPRRGVQYKGAPLDAEKGPGLGCFWSQVVVLGILIVLTPLSVAWNWPVIVSGALLVIVLLLLLFAGQTVIFLLRLVAADRRAAGRRRPLGSATKTVGELEDAAPDGADAGTAGGAAPGADRDAAAGSDPGADADTSEPPADGVRE